MCALACMHVRLLVCLFDWVLAFFVHLRARWFGCVCFWGCTWFVCLRAWLVVRLFGLGVVCVRLFACAYILTCLLSLVCFAVCIYV